MNLISPLAQQAGYRVERYESLSSTNELSLSKGEDRLWIVADQQTNGRGRLGRSWISPLGNLYASLSYVLEPDRVLIPHIGFLAGIILAQSLENLLPINLTLKWPNDILYQHAKLAGILVETRPRPDGKLTCVMGFGVNCHSSPSDLPYPTTSLREIGFALPPPLLLCTLSHAIALRDHAWFSILSLDEIRAQWKGPVVYQQASPS